MRVVCFDLGGVLVEINHRWKGALLDAGFPPEIAGAFDVPLTDFGPFNEYQKGRIDLQGYLAALGAYFATTSARALDVHNAILRQTYPGVPEFLQDVHRAGLASGVLSNTNAPHWEAMQSEPRLAVLTEIRFPLASHLIGAEKPDPAMYRAFEDASGASGREIVYFDDGAGNVESAIGLGWTAFHIDPEDDPARTMREHLSDLGWLSSQNDVLRA